MVAQALKVRPGINSEATSLLAENAWVSGSLIRFFQGLLQKLGGWIRLTSTRILGTARAMLSWEDAASNQYLAIGSEQAFEVYSAGVLYNVTPIQSTVDITPSFSTTIGLPTVTVTNVANPAVAGDVVGIVNSISVGGIILQGSYTVQSVIDADNYTITVAANATSTATNAGAAATFTTANLSADVSVNLANHGLAIGEVFTVYISTTVATVILLGPYAVVTVPDGDNFTITASSAANANASGAENGGNVEIQYFIPSGPASSSNQGGIYGAGPYGLGVYGIGSTATFVQARLWSFGYWGTDVVASFTGSSVYTWVSENGLINNPAVDIATSPRRINAGIFTAMPQQQVVALGASNGTSSDPDLMLVRWSDISDNTAWTATATNQAGSFRIPRGAHIAGGIQGPQAGLIWTDVGLWLMQYIGFPLVYGFTEIGQGCGLIGQNAKGALAGKVYWMSFNSFFVYDGNSVQALPCAVWDEIFRNINKLQVAKIIACPNSFFNEMSWSYPSADSDENDSRVTYNSVDGTWTFDPPAAIVRTAWLDQSSLLNPLGVDGNGLLQQHEVGTDDDTQAMVSYAQTGFFKIADGLDFTFIERLIPDALLSSCTLQITMYFQDYPGSTPFIVGPLNFTSAVNYLIVRGRGRFVSLRFESSDEGSFWRLGEPLYFGSKAGRR